MSSGTKISRSTSSNNSKNSKKNSGGGGTENELKIGKSAQPTADQIRIAQLTDNTQSTADPKLKELIEQYMTYTGQDREEAVLFLHDHDNNVAEAVDAFFEGESASSGWLERTKRKKTKANKVEVENKENRRVGANKRERSGSRPRGGAAPSRGRGRGRRNEGDSSGAPGGGRGGRRGGRYMNGGGAPGSNSTFRGGRGGRSSRGGRGGTVSGSAPPFTDSFQAPYEPPAEENFNSWRDQAPDIGDPMAMEEFDEWTGSLETTSVFVASQTREEPSPPPASDLSPTDAAKLVGSYSSKLESSNQIASFAAAAAAGNANSSNSSNETSSSQPAVMMPPSPKQPVMNSTAMNLAALLQQAVPASNLTGLKRQPTTSSNGSAIPPMLSNMNNSDIKCNSSAPNGPSSYGNSYSTSQNAMFSSAINNSATQTASNSLPKPRVNFHPDDGVQMPSQAKPSTKPPKPTTKIPSSAVEMPEDPMAALNMQLSGLKFGVDGFDFLPDASSSSISSNGPVTNTPETEVATTNKSPTNSAATIPQTQNAVSANYGSPPQFPPPPTTTSTVHYNSQQQNASAQSAPQNMNSSYSSSYHSGYTAPSQLPGGYNPAPPAGFAPNTTQDARLLQQPLGVHSQPKALSKLGPEPIPFPPSSGEQQQYMSAIVNQAQQSVQAQSNAPASTQKETLETPVSQSNQLSTTNQMHNQSSNQMHGQSSNQLHSQSSNQLHTQSSNQMHSQSSMTAANQLHGLITSSAATSSGASSAQPQQTSNSYSSYNMNSKTSFPSPPSVHYPQQQSKYQNEVSYPTPAAPSSYSSQHYQNYSNETATATSLPSVATNASSPVVSSSQTQKTTAASAPQQPSKSMSSSSATSAASGLSNQQSQQHQTTSQQSAQQQTQHHLQQQQSLHHQPQHIHQLQQQILVQQQQQNQQPFVNSSAALQAANQISYYPLQQHMFAGYEELQTVPMQQRMPHMAAQVPSTLAGSREASLSAGAYSGADISKFRSDQNSSPVPSAINTAGGHGGAYLNSGTNMHPMYMYQNVAVPSTFPQYAPTIIQLPPNTGSGNSQYQAAKMQYNQTTNYYETQTAPDYKTPSYGSSGGAGSQAKQSPSAPLNSSVPDMAPYKNHITKSYEKSGGYHASTPPPFNLPGSGGPYAHGPVFLPTIPPAQHHNTLLHHQLHQEGGGPRGGNGPQNKVGSKNSYSNQAFWGS